MLAHGSLVKAIAMVILGLLLGLVGTDVNSGVARFTFGISELSDGIGFVAVAMGMFGFAEIITNLEDKGDARGLHQEGDRPAADLAGLQGLLGRDPARHRCSARRSASCPAAARCSPRSPPTRWRRSCRGTRPKFGKGEIQGVAAPESANNAGAQTSFIPLLTLGIPSNPVMALMIGAMMIQGIAPGPQVMTERPQLFWGMIASMWVGNLMLVILNLPLIGMWIKLLDRALPAALPGDPAVLRHRRVHDLQQPVRRAC